MNCTEKFRRFAAECRAMAKFTRSPESKGMSRFLLNIEKRSLSWLTLCGVGLASKNAMQDFILVRVQSGT